MFDIGIGEIVLLVVAGLIVVGPERLPSYAAQAAKLLRQVRGQVAEVKSVITDAVAIEPDFAQDLRDLNPRRILEEPEPIKRSRASSIDPDTT
ncbi:MAG: twin-arginine translocase subunit TatB [Actinomycetota bacterium]|jgi:sec-independent protein translocase protein TatB